MCSAAIHADANTTYPATGPDPNDAAEATTEPLCIRDAVS
jgi:hypothetical protein